MTDDVATLETAKRYAVDRSTRRNTQAAFDQLRRSDATVLTVLVENLLQSTDQADRALGVRLAPGLAEVLSTLLSALEREQDPVVLAAFAEAFGELQGEEASEQLRRLAANEDSEVRQAVATSMYGRRDSTAFETLISLIRDPDDDVSGWAASALADTFDPSEKRNTELERWLDRTEPDSQLARLIRTSLESNQALASLPRRRSMRERPKSKRRSFTVLVASANPGDTDQLALDEEVRSLTAAIRATPARDSVKLQTAWALRPYDLLVELNEHRPEVLHFSGHGMADGRLVFVDEAGGPKPVDGAAISSTLATAGESVRVVVLNACFSAALAESLTAHVDVAVGMDLPVGDDAAIVFARAFYSALGYGSSVGRAFEQARTALMLEGHPEHAIARLSARDGVDPYEVFLVDLSVPSEETVDNVENLRRVTVNHLEHLARHASLRVGEGLEIVRSVGEVLRQRSETGSVFVIGAPGTGKSGAIYRLSRDLQASGRDVVVLAADLLTASGRRGLREELSIGIDLVDVLASWKGEDSAFLIIDALDAARGREAQTVLLELIETVARKGGRWRVVASVRTFDLRHNPDLQAAIPARQAATDQVDVDPEFVSVRHVAVGDLTDAELKALAEAAPDVGDFLEAAPVELRDLLRVPFNLRLLAALLGRDEVDKQRLYDLRTQIELLDLYWDRRVLTPALGRDARELLATNLCRTAVATMRLQVSRESLRGDAAAHAPHFEELLSEGVLVEARGPGVRQDTVGFAHHVLFDYATHRLLLSGDPDEIARQLSTSEELILIARPSLVFTLVSAWEADGTREVFWNLVLRLAAEDVPPVARLVGPTVATERFVSSVDTSPLIAALDHGDTRAPFVLRHIVGARAAGGLPARPLAGVALGLWAELAVELSCRITSETMYPIRILVWGLASERKRLGKDDVSALGVASRALLEWAWDQTPSPQQEVQVALEGVARSCPSDSAATDQLLSRALDTERIARFGAQEVRLVTDEIPSLVRCIPDFVARLYETAFGYDEKSEETTAFGPGQILRLTSTRRQDWQMVRYSLVQQFPAVLASDLRIALRALAAACVDEASEWSGYDQRRILHFKTSSGDAEALVDGSQYWGSGSHRDVASMLDDFEDALADADAEPATITAVVPLLAEEPLPVAIWVRLLRAVARAPEGMATAVARVPASPDALMSSDLLEPLCELLRVGPSFWTAEQQAEIEDAVVSLPSQYSAERREAGALRRDHFLLCMPPDHLQRDDARRLRGEAEARHPDELPRDRRQGVWTRAFDEDEELHARGIDPNHPETQELVAAISSVSNFVSTHVNTAPSTEEAHNVVEPIVRLRELQSELRDRVDDSVLEDAQAWLSEAAAALASQTPLAPDAPPILLARELALEGAEGAVPRSEGDIEQFDRSGPSWGVPSGRIDAARALLLLSREPRLAGSDLFAAIERLADDRHPAVRWMVAQDLGLARQTDPERVWQLTNHIAEHERSAQVLGALLRPLSAFLDERPDEVATILRRLYDAEVSARRNESLVRGLAGFLIEIWVWRGHPMGRKLVDEWLDDILPNAGVAHTTFYGLRNVITHGDEAPHYTGIRQRAIAVWADLSRAAGDAFQAAEPAIRSGEQTSQELTEQLGDVARLLDSSATELYFGSGAYAEENAERREPLTDGVRRRFYREGIRIVDVLAPIGLPSIAHHVLQTLAAYVEIDPRGILLRIGDVLDAGRRWGYQLESLAEREVVTLVEVYLASHRDLLLRDRDSRQVLIRALDGFVEAGWPSARRLLYGLDDMFR